jgi:sugar phosphate isomerase/epimerase
MRLKLAYTVATPDTTTSPMLAYRGDLDRVFGDLQGLGYDGVELMLRDPAALDAAGIAALARAHGLQIAAIGTGQVAEEDGLTLLAADETTRAAAVERLQAILRFAGHLGAPVVIGRFRGSVPRGINREQGLDWLAAALTAGAATAREAGVPIVIEPQNRFNTNIIFTVMEGVALIERVGSEWITVLGDTFHMNIEEVSMTAPFLTAGRHLRHVHFGDSNRLAPGRGHLNFPEIVAALDAARYDGFISLEIVQAGDSARAARQSIAYLRALE